eukprot:1674668-Rhodomonas_salina.2
MGQYRAWHRAGVGWLRTAPGPVGDRKGTGLGSEESERSEGSEAGLVQRKRCAVPRGYSMAGTTRKMPMQSSRTSCFSERPCARSYIHE